MTTTGKNPLWTSLYRLAWVRLFALGAITLGLAIVHCSEVSIEFAPLAGAILFLAAADALTFLRLRRPGRVTEREIFAQLLVDAAALTSVLYFAGGAANPLAGCYVLLVLYAALTLASRWAWAFAGICVASYSAVEFFYVRLWRDDVPDPAIEFLAPRAIALLLLVLVACIGVRLNDLRREQQSHVSSHARQEARERYLLGLATLSAGTAHEMSTPLMTMGVVLGDLRRRQNPPHDWKQSIDLLWEQTQVCKHSLSELVHASNVERLGMLRRSSARQLVHDVGNRFQLQRPSVSFRLRGIRFDDSLMLESDDTLSEALFKFLDSAADASPHSVELRAAARKTDKIVIHVLDRGPGAAPQPREPIASGPVTIDPRGRRSGAKVLVAQAAIERFGGTVQIFDRARGGTDVQIELPMSRSNEEEDHEYREPRIAAG